MALPKLEKRNYGGKWPMSINYQNLYSFKEGLILLCQSIFETRRITHLQGSAHFTIHLTWLYFDNEPRVQERQQVKDQQSCISVFVAYPTIPSSN